MQKLVLILLSAFALVAFTFVVVLARTRVQAYRSVICLDGAKAEAFAKKDALCVRDDLEPGCARYWHEQPNAEVAEILRDWNAAVQACSTR